MLVVEGGRHPGLAEETSSSRLVRQEVPTDKLDRHGSFETRVPRPVYDAHAALSQLLADPVMPESSGDRGPVVGRGFLLDVV
jgi:hypothetical protein